MNLKDTSSKIQAFRPVCKAELKKVIDHLREIITSTNTTTKVIEFQKSKSVARSINS